MSATSKTQRFTLETPVQYLKGVGPRMGTVLAERGIQTLGDLLRYYPRDYQDRSQVQTVSGMVGEAPVLLRGKITGYRFVPIRRLKRPLLEATFQDSTGRVSLKWFHYQRAYFEEKFKSSPEVMLYGRPKMYGSRLEFLHPELEFLSDDAHGDESVQETEAPGILPIYVEPEGLTQRGLRRMLTQTLELVGSQIQDDIPEIVLKKYSLMPLRDAVGLVHAPTTRDATHIEKLRAFRTEEQRRLIFDDFFKFEWAVGLRRINLRRDETTAYKLEGGVALLTQLKKILPFELTADQQNAINKIYEDLGDTKPMNRLLQGDVGCGKTLVAMASAFPVIAAGSQAVFMAPTEILSNQHLATAQRWIASLKNSQNKTFGIALLVGSTTKAERARILEGLKSNQIQLIFGTHALLEPSVEFARLGFVVIDEQHRFGVDQRMALRQKGTNPHMLSLSATPIPRTLALTAYGDLDVSVIRQLPKGRPEVTTRIISKPQREAMFDAIRKQLSKGRQAYIIYPLVAESEKMDLANAIQGAEELANGALSGYRVGLLHGKMKSAEKDAVMEQFKKCEVQALVSTTVVEVGVDVPNATVLVVENAERFGLSQLHQLRGRIGRGTEESFCFLLPSHGGVAETSFERLRAMEETRDGFRLAELDLKIRGPGEFLGTRQSGDLNFPCADLVRDQDILIQARQAAFDIIKDDPELKRPENQSLQNYMTNKGLVEQSRFETA